MKATTSAIIVRENLPTVWLTPRGTTNVLTGEDTCIWELLVRLPIPMDLRLPKFRSVQTTRRDSALVLRLVR